MSLSSLQLDAFIAVAHEKSFSGAALKMAITQSALSQRVLNLEHELGTSLFIRESSGLRLTESGEKLLRYCQTKEMLETEAIAHLKETSHSLAGIIRIGVFSSLAKPVIARISEFIKHHPDVQVEMVNSELRHLPDLLSTGQVDFIFLNAPLERQQVECHHVGFEDYVFVRSTKRHSRSDVYLDHDKEDMTTFDFFKQQGQKKILKKRSYFNNIDLVIEATRQGIGMALVPAHLIHEQKGLEIVSDYKSYKSPVYFCYYIQSFYAPLQKVVIDLFRQKNFFEAN